MEYLAVSRLLAVFDRFSFSVVGICGHELTEHSHAALLHMLHQVAASSRL